MTTTGTIGVEMATPIEPAYFSVLELARYLGVSRRTAYNLVAAGEVPSVRVGGQYRIPRADLERLLARRKSRDLSHERTEPTQGGLGGFS